MSPQPQLGIPDVFIWMLTGSKRVAYVRIPVNDLMYSKSKFKRGKHCGTTSSFFLKVNFVYTCFNHDCIIVLIAKTLMNLLDIAGAF